MTIVEILLVRYREIKTQTYFVCCAEREGTASVLVSVPSEGLLYILSETYQTNPAAAKLVTHCWWDKTMFHRMCCCTVFGPVWFD